MLSNNNRSKNQLKYQYQKLLITFLSFFSIILFYNNLFAANIKVTFNPSQDSRVEGYYFYYGQSENISKTNYGDKIKLGSDTFYEGSNFEEGTTYYFAATAYDKYGNESVFSEILSYKVPEQTQVPDDDENNNSDFQQVIEDFQDYPVGDSPLYWLNTGAENSMYENNSLFEIFGIDGNNAFGTTSTLTNIHSHYIGQKNIGLSSFEYTGRMLMTDSKGGIGVTFLSQYPFADAYYRLRSYNSSTFHISAHPDGKKVFGIINTGVIPQVNLWYRFRIKVNITGTNTGILAKVWPQHTSEPADWQINAYDDSSTRLSDGTFGLWSMADGAKFWDDLTILDLNSSIDDSKDNSDDFSESYFLEDFQGYSVGDNPTDWLNTGAHNSMTENKSLFEIFGIGNNNVFGTTSTLTNIHSHYIGPKSTDLSSLSSFEYTGRMIMTDSNGGIGVTFLSQYPANDAYYRLRSYNNGSFHIAPHPNGKEVSGITDTSVIPEVNEWYQFRIRVRITSTKTEILAKVWPQYASEPSDWQINAYDDASGRLVDGTFGIWSYGAGYKFWDDIKLFQ